MAKTARNIAVSKSLDGQILQYSDTNLTADNIDVFEGGTSGNKLMEIGSKTKHTTIAKIRLMGGTGIADANPNIQYLTHDYDCPGVWVVDASDTTSADNTGTVLVTAGSARLKRKFSGDVHAEWFGISTSGGDQSVKLQAALDAAAILFRDCSLQSAASYFLFNTVNIPSGVHFRLGKSTTLRAFGTDGQILLTMSKDSFLSGGWLNVGASDNTVGVFFWGGNNYALDGKITGIDGTRIYGSWASGQTAIRLACGTDSSGAEQSSNTGQYITFLKINCSIGLVEYGIKSEILGSGDAFINGNIFNCNITAVKGITFEGVGNLFNGEIQSQTEAGKPGFTGYWAAKITGDSNRISGYIWDWTPTDTDKFAVMIIGDGNESQLSQKINGLQTFFTTATDIKGLSNRTSIIEQDKVIAPRGYPSIRFLGTQDDFFFYAHKKFKVSKTLSENIDSCFTQFGTIIHITDAAIGSEKSITIEKNDSTALFTFGYYCGILFHNSSYPENLKIEIEDSTGAWTEVINYAGDAVSDVMIDLSGNSSSTIYGVRYTFSSSKASIGLSRIYAFANDPTETYLPIGGGNMYGNITFMDESLQGLSYLATDASGNIQAASAPASPETEALKVLDTGTSYTILSTDRILAINISGSSFTFTLPDNPGTNQELKIFWMAQTTPLSTTFILGSGQTGISGQGDMGATQEFSGSMGCFYLKFDTAASMWYMLDFHSNVG